MTVGINAHLQHEPMPGNHTRAESHAEAHVHEQGRSDRWAPAQLLIMGGSDDSGNGLAYLQRLSGVAPGQAPAWTAENMAGYRRFEGCAVLLPDGTVSLTSGAQYGAALPLHRLLRMHPARRRSPCAARQGASRAAQFLYRRLLLQATPGVPSTQTMRSTTSRQRPRYTRPQRLSASAGRSC